jgi:hypothetical protein
MATNIAPVHIQQGVLDQKRLFRRMPQQRELGHVFIFARVSSQ